MTHWDRIYQLHQILKARRTPIAPEDIAERLECSVRTVRRLANDLGDHLGAPLIKVKEPVFGYQYDRQLDEQFELPGLWFNDREIHALLTVDRLLNTLEPGLLDAELAPLRKRLGGILERRQLGSGELAERVRILAMQARATGACFKTVAGAVLSQQQLKISYHARSSNQLTARKISPQRITHYRDNWYLDAWDHGKESLRSFSLDRIESAEASSEPAKLLAAELLDEHLSGSYGIFSGKPDQIAVLIFSAERARWVADERWHPQQKSSWLEDGSYRLEVPYHHDSELVLDILRYGADVQVQSPSALKKRVREQLQQALKNYS